MIGQIENLEDMVNRANVKAGLYHRGQTYGGLEYTDHLEAVVNALPREDFKSEQEFKYAQAVAWLHDILEDTSMSPEMLDMDFPKEVCIAVQFLTDPPAPNRKIKKAMFLAGLKEAEKSNNPEIKTALYIARIVKMADRYCNTKHSFETRNTKKLNMYKSEYGVFSLELGFYPTKISQKLEKLMDEVKAVEA